MATLTAWSPPAEARDGEVSISSRTLPEALAELSREESISIGTEGALPRVRTPRIVRAASVSEALDRLLAGTGLKARRVATSTWRIERIGAVGADQGTSPDAGAPSPEVVTAPIVVTATKRRQALGDAPVAVAVVQLPDTEDSDAARDSAWAVDRLDGVSLAGEGPGRNRMFLRGVADSPFNGDSQSTVAVLLDDSRLTYSAPDPDIRLVDVDRVEVLKGPQGALYGTGALGGIYRIVTRRPDTSRSRLEIGSAGEALASGGSGGSGSIMANMPLARDVAALRLVAYAGKNPGWIQTGNRTGSNASSVIGARASLGVEPANGWRVDATAFGQWLNSSDSSYVYATESRDRPAQLAEPHDNDLRHLALRAEREAAIGIILASGITWHEVRDRYDATQGTAGFGLAAPSYLNDTRDYRTWDSELRLTGAFGAIEWLAGLSHVEARQDTATLLQSNPASLSLQSDKRVVSDSAAFGEGTLALSREFDLLVGARLFRTHFLDNRTAGPVAAISTDTKVGATPSAALSWRSRRGRLAYLRYGSAFRQGGSSLTPSGQLQTLAGDELGTFEAGWRETVGAATLDFDAYYSRWENVQSDVLGPNGLLTTRNAGNARIIGAELSASGSPAHGWLIDAGATWQSALLIRNDTGIELDDRRLPAIPEYTLRVGASRSWTLGAGEARLGTTLRYVGPGRFSFQPELDLPMGKYLDAAFEGQLRFDHVTIGVKVENPLGLKSDTFPFGNPLRASLARQYTPQRPASVSLQVRFSA